MDGIKIVREYFPELSEGEAGYVLWNKTGWPGFFDDGENSLRSQLSKYRRAFDLRRDVCCCCGKIRHSSEMDKFGMYCKYFNPETD